MLSCKEVSELISQSLDAGLPLWQRLLLRMHLVMCGFCARFRKQTSLLRDAARHYAMAEKQNDAPAGTGLSPEARERIKRLLRAL